MKTRTKPIIAVFGSGSATTFPLAHQLGREIVSQNAILLTGGSLDPKEIATVKEQAILGACVARLGGAQGSCVGVERGNAPQVHPLPGNLGIVIETDLNHRRNALEACLCDGAVVLEGGDGTASEALFTLLLGKPVAFVGAGWGKKYNLSVPGAASNNWVQLVADAAKRVPVIPSTDAPLDSYFPSTTISADPSQAKNWQCHGTAATATTIVASLLGTTIRGSFPPIPRYAAAISAYESWLKTV